MVPEEFSLFRKIFTPTQSTELVEFDGSKIMVLEEFSLFRKIFTPAQNLISSHKKV